MTLITTWIVTHQRSGLLLIFLFDKISFSITHIYNLQICIIGSLFEYYVLVCVVFTGLLITLKEENTWVLFQKDMNININLNIYTERER